MSVVGSSVLAGASGQSAGGGGAGGPRSLRFNSSDTAYLSRTPSSAGNRRTWTWSGWLKRSRFTAASETIFSAQGSSSHTLFNFYGSTTKFALIPNAGVAGATFQSNALFRDTSAWYHFVIAFDTTQSTSTERVKVYVNGEELTWSSSTYPSQNEEWNINIAGAHNIGRATQVNSYLTGYLADIHFIDGQALAPTNFGEFNTDNLWVLKAYGGTYGTNGFHLDFADNSSAAALGTDAAGSNDWNVNNLSVAAGAGNDSLADHPTNGDTTNDTGLGAQVNGNYATLNSITPIGNNCTFSNGNLDVTVGGSTNNRGNRGVSTIGMTSGKWYCEHVINSGKSNIGVVSSLDYGADDGSGNYWIGSGPNDYIVWSHNGQSYNSGSGSSYGVSWTTGDVIGCAFDADAGNMYIYKNGTVMNSGTPSHTGLTDGPYFFIFTEVNSSVSVNFGARAFAHTAPSGYKSLNTANLTPSTIADGSKYFDTKLWTGNGAANPQTGLGFSPDLVWIKNRDTTGYSHALMDSVRGPSKQVRSNTTGAESTSSTTLTSFDSNGFTVNNNNISNQTGKAYVAWCFDKSSSSGTDIVAYTGNSSGRTVGHSCGSAPEVIIVKSRTSTLPWRVYHKGLGDINAYLTLNETSAVSSSSSYPRWNGTAPTSSVFSVGTSNDINKNGDNFIAFLFAPVEGYSAMGKYSANTTAGAYPFIYTGFKPRWIMIKNISAAWGWYIHDTARNPENPANKNLIANASNSEATYNILDIHSNGFKITGVSEQWNHSSNDYIYLAFASHPFASNGGLAR